VDIKCPASGEAHRNEWSNIDRLTPDDEVKFVIADRQDYEFARDVVRRFDLSRRCRTVLFSPVHGTMDLQALAGWVLTDALPVRLQVQLHKYIWGPHVRGV
jgi:7-carboxy-7-deazaguanine synthase